MELWSFCTLIFNIRASRILDGDQETHIASDDIHWFNANVWNQYSPLLSMFIGFYAWKIAKNTVFSSIYPSLSHCDPSVECQVMQYMKGFIKGISNQLMWLTLEEKDSRFIFSPKCKS